MVCVLGQKSSFYKSICLQKRIKLYLLDFLADSHPVLMADFFLCRPGGYFAAFAAVVPAAHFPSSHPFSCLPAL